MKVIGIYFPTSLICFIVNMNMNLQTSSSCSEFSPLCGILYGCQRSAVPTACNLGKEPVFYWIELGAIRWIVDDHDVHSESVCQVHEVLLDNFVGTGIGSAPVTEKHLSAGGWICVAVFTFFYAGIDSLLVNSEKFADFAHTVTSASHSLRCHITSFLTFIERRHKISIFLIELSWRRFRSHFKISGIILKVTKFSPILQVYLINNQLIKQIIDMFYNMLSAIFEMRCDSSTTPSRKLQKAA